MVTRPQAEDYGSEPIDVSSFLSPEQQQQFMSDAANLDNLSASMNSDELGTPTKMRDGTPIIAAKILMEFITT